MRAFSTYCMMEVIPTDFFKVDEFFEGSLLKRSVENLEIFESFSAYVVEGRGCSVDTAKTVLVMTQIRSLLEPSR